MKRFSLILLLSSVAFAAATTSVINFYEWKPIIFSFDPNAATAAMSEMSADKDPTLKEMEENYPAFRSNFLRAFAFVSDSSLQSYLVPPMGLYISEDAATADDRVREMGYYIGSAAERVRSDILQSVKNATAGDWDDEDRHGYVYCEKNPTVTIDACEDNYSYEWVFARRLVSKASFVRNMCPVFTNFAIWNMNWNNQSANHDENFRLFFEEMDRVLGLYYNGGVWTHTILGAVASPLSEDFLGTIERRYLDGGPELMLAMKDCLSSTYKAYLSQPRAADPLAGAPIESLLKFQDVPFHMTGQTLAVQTALLNRGTLYRLMRHMDSSNLVAPLSGTEVWFSMGNMVSVTSMLSQSDALYNYRMMTKSEFEELRKDNQPIVMRDRVCLVSHNYIDGGMGSLTFFESDGADVYEAYSDDDCTSEQWAIIRERK